MATNTEDQGTYQSVVERAMNIAKAPFQPLKRRRFRIGGLLSTAVAVITLAPFPWAALGAAVLVVAALDLD